MAWTRKTWLWIVVGVLGLGVVFIVAVAGFGIYFVTSHVSASRTSTADAFRAFDDVRARFKDERPVFELDERERPRQIRPFAEIPTSQIRTDVLWVLVWDPDRERLVKVSMPYWVLRLGKQNIDISSGDFDFQRLRLDVSELERVGPVLLFDYRSIDGERVLVWTQ